MSLLDYQEAVPWANAIQLAVLEGRMPPFLPGDGGPFRDARALTALELDTLVDWAVGATPEGESLSDEESLPPSEAAAADLLLQPQTDVVLLEEESETAACIVFLTGLEAPRIVSGLEVFPGEPRILRRATIFEGVSCSGAEPIATWLPDRKRISFPQGVGRQLPASASLLLELHYVKGWGDEGKRIVDRSALGLWFTEGAEPIRSVPIDERLDLKQGVRLVALYAASAGDAPIRVEAVEPDGTVRRLLSIDRFDPAWNEKYFFRTPIPLPAGSMIRASRSGVWADLVSAGASGNDR